MTRFFIFIALLVPSLSLAQSETYLQNLLTVYHESSQPNPEDLVGAYSGRCYRQETPNLPFGLLLFGRMTHPENPDHGPLFPPPEAKLEYNVFGIGFQGTQAPADYWDNYTPEKEQSVWNAVAQGEIGTAWVWNRSLSVRIPHRNILISTRIEDGHGYLISRIMVESPYNQAPLFAACYFFKKVR